MNFKSVSDEIIMAEIQMSASTCADIHSEETNTTALDTNASKPLANHKNEMSNADVVAAMEEEEEKEYSLSSSSESTDTDNEHEPQEVSANTKYKIEATTLAVPTTIKSTSIGDHSSESEDDYCSPNDIASQSQLDQQCAVLRNDINTNYIKFKWRKLLRKPLLCSRVLALILTVILLLVSFTYCIAQLCEVELDLLTECPPPVKEREEIWQHYEQRSLQSDTPGLLTSETHHGSTKDNCWTTKSFELNTDALFYSNNYKHQWKDKWDGKMILFGCISMYCVVIIMYGVATIVLDVIDVRSNTLHTKSPLYHDLLRQQGQQTAKIQNKTQKEPLLLNCFRKVRKWYDRYLAMDTTGWIMVMFIHEFLEIILQSQALFQYNGYYVLDPSNEKDIYLANKREYIIAFASILAFNCFASGLCWASYSLAHHKCHGLLFKFSIFFVDQFSDLFYTVFPFIVTFTDSYNKNRTNILILLGQLNVESGLAFIAAFIPLVFLCNKCFFITINSV
eukprot:302167_1